MCMNIYIYIYRNIKYIYIYRNINIYIYIYIQVIHFTKSSVSYFVNFLVWFSKFHESLKRPTNF